METSGIGGSRTPGIGKHSDAGRESTAIKRTVLRPAFTKGSGALDEMRDWAMQAYAHLHAYRFAEAIEACDCAIGVQWHPEVLALKSLALDWTGEHAKAEAVRAEIFAEAPDHPKTLYYRAQDCVRQERYEEALDDLERAIRGLDYLAQEAREDGAFDAFHPQTPTNDLQVPGWPEEAPEAARSRFEAIVSRRAASTAPSAPDAFSGSASAGPASSSPLSRTSAASEARFFDWLDLNSLEVEQAGSPDPTQSFPAVLRNAWGNQLVFTAAQQAGATVVFVEQRRTPASSDRQLLSQGMATQLLESGVVRRSPELERAWGELFAQIARGTITWG